jgi:hypothetical protein
VLDGDEELGDADAVLELLARGGPPVRLPDGALVAAPERVPGDDGEGQLPPDRPQLAPCRVEQGLPQLVRKHRRPAQAGPEVNVQLAAVVGLGQPGPVEHVKGLVEDAAR